MIRGDWEERGGLPEKVTCKLMTYVTMNRVLKGLGEELSRYERASAKALR